MLYVALALTAALVAAAAVFAGVVRSVLRDAARERAQNALERERMIDQLCHLAGRPWGQPPVTVTRRFDPGEPDAWIIDPEHAEL
jgi:hypothetical protein